MEISDQLLCLFSARVEARNGSYVIEVPERELDVGALTEGETYRVAMCSGVTDQPSSTEPNTGATDTQSSPEPETPAPDQAQPTPPVSEGETRTVEIEALGDQGDGITRVERGFVVIVPDTEKGERVVVEITDVRETVAFATVRERKSYYE